MLDYDDSNSFDSNSYSQSPSAAEPAFGQNQAACAIIGSKIRFKGELIGEEDLVIQGTVDGTIDLKGNNLTVGKTGVVRANVSAKTVVVEGKVEGDMFGEEKITIKESSQVRGNIIAARVCLEEGAKFKGSIDMDMDEPAAKAVTTLASKTDSVTSIDSSSKKSGDFSEKSKAKLP